MTLGAARPPSFTWPLIQLDTPTPEATSTLPLLCPHPLQRLGYQQLFLVRLFPGDGSGLGCTGSVSSTVGSLELLGTGPKMPAYFQPGGQPENAPEDPASASRGPERTLGLRARGCGCAGVCFPLAISLDRDSAWGSLSLCHPSVVVTVSWDREARGENSRSSIKSPHRATIPLR